MIRLGRKLCFPPVDQADSEGLLAFGGDLSIERLLLAYSEGIFPWYGPGCPILWWSPDPRFVLLPEEFHLPRSLRRVLKGDRFEVSMDQAFGAVIQACAFTPRPGAGQVSVNSTWLVPDMLQAYIALHAAGHAHSIEVWEQGSLVGGLYGVALGQVFFGESMFHMVPEASKVALVYLVAHLRAHDFTLLDCQQNTAHMGRFGGKEMPRARFIEYIKNGIQTPCPQAPA